MVYPQTDAEFTKSHKSDLIQFGVCGRWLSGTCDRDPCPFEHALPQAIDLSSDEWKIAAKGAAEYRAKRRAEFDSHKPAADRSIGFLARSKCLQ